ncbi:MAG: glycosyltransferase family 2 protein [Sphingomonadaceae bacterium]|uniref:glycosyltransferase family 2 protein n=1 Tax=Thermaurantiacus sp. TaxID=2820283 RepID=UPI00298F11C0|nr:glycosyltransferase family 2 protein [Thermaurantiacus sp.]MCS6986098.1 glycosyltransferase family 2 protein [Sphingomonadaceae bacterium]MDW8414686.1 glycosyltransferase family 2 protein [Thermaurantiacus sp.]
MTRPRMAGEVPLPEPPPQVRAQPARLAVVVVNWNGWQDTVECLESLLRQSLPPRIVVVDNGSEDGSVERLQAWAEGRLPYEPPVGPLRRLTDPPVEKPVRMVVRPAAEAATARPAEAEVTLLVSPENVGFSAGTNLGLRHALNDPAIAYCWCLNNDTVADPGAVKAIVARMDATHRVGMCGTQVRYYHRPGHWQALNGHRFNLWTGQSRGIGHNLPVNRPFDPKKVARETDFVLGASLAVSRAFLETVGFMEESYFLYFEEMDWAVRNRGRFATAFAHAAVVYHKEGGSIGSSDRKGERSAMSEYYLMRSRLRFYRRNFPLLLPIQYGLGLGLVLRRLWRRQPAKAAAMVRAMLGLDFS